MLMIIADGVWWRRALEPDFDPSAVLPIFMDITRHMLRGRPKSVADGESKGAVDTNMRGAAAKARLPANEESSR